MKYYDYDEKYSFEKSFCKAERVESGFFSGKRYYFVRCFNVDDKTKKYDFGATPDSKPQKFFKGLCRVPYKDGWEYQINVKFHLELIATLRHYENKGFAADGSSTAYLRHNKRALGIHYLLLRYVKFNTRNLNEFKQKQKNGKLRDSERGEFSFYIPSNEFEFVPYFPTPETYEGVNAGRRSFRYHYHEELAELRKEVHLEPEE